MKSAPFAACETIIQPFAAAWRVFFYKEKSNKKFLTSLYVRTATKTNNDGYYDY
jgi:hypothetical protein